MVQEGVYTFESVNDAFAEPVIYMIDHFVVGGFYRVHTARGQDENLNAPGMQFVPLAFEDTCLRPTWKAVRTARQPLLRVRRGSASRAARRRARAGADGGSVRGQDSRAQRGTQQPFKVAGA